jgi:hypothetical protein
VSKELSEQLKAYFSPIVTDEVTVEMLNATIHHGISIHRCLMDEAGIENSMSFSSGDMIVIYQRKEGKKHFDLWVEAKEKIKELEAWKSDVMHVINESSGVAGYHLNGEIATWGELGLDGE